MQLTHYSLLSQKRNGFALVATVSVMVLLVLIALAMLSLSTISMREQRQLSAQQEARANARMALMLALGRLQMELGPDRRISAPSSTLDNNQSTPKADGVNNPSWLGVWDAHNGGALTYEAGRENSFRAWLVSHPSQSEYDHAADAGFGADNSIRMTANNGLGEFAKAGLIDVRNGKGKLAWHVQDNAMRARVNQPVEPAVDIAELISRRGAAARHAPESLPELAGLAVDQASMEKLITPETVPLALPVAPSVDGWQHSLTSESVSLMTDVVSGGWRKDINTLFEQDDPNVFEQLGYGRWQGSGAFNSTAAYLHGPTKALGARWSHLHAFYNLYKRVTFNGGVPQVKPHGRMIDWHLADQYRDFGDEAGGFSFPRIAKIMYVFSYSSQKSASNPGKYELKLETDIFVTLWNPYNTRIVFPDNCAMYIKFSPAIPMRFDWYKNGMMQGSAGLNDIFRSGVYSLIESKMYQPKHGALFAMEPGEVLMFSKSGNDYRNLTNFNNRDSQPKTYVLGSGKLIGSGNDRISVSLKPDEHGSSFPIGGQQISQYCDFWIRDMARGWPYYEHRGEIVAQREAPFIQRMPAVDHDDVVSVSLAEVENRKQPFGAFVVEMKTAQDSVDPTTAFIHTGISRLSNRMGSNLGEWNSERMDYRLEPVTSFNSDLIQTTTATHPAGAYHGFIGSGRTFQTGVTHVMHAGIPVLPMTSLAEFQHAAVGDGASTLRATHWGFNSTPLHPYMDYAVGNSFAHPLLPKNAKRSGNYYDHSYHANEVLWDHYFCSSLAPQTQSIFNYKRDMPAVWSDFLRDGKPMLNHRFRAYLGNKSVSEVEKQVINGSSIEQEGFKKIAANLLYDGGFNVNSTSVDAWKAFLSGARHEQLRILETFKPSATAKTVDAKGTPFSRTKLPLAESITEASSDVQRQYLGFRDLTDEQITELAENIVEQVKKRGPFLSMGDFVNRQLTNDTDLAKSGTLQSAIDQSSINDVVKANGLAVSGAGKGFAFPQAAEGNTAVGSPGWLIQGDILTPLGPSMFVRGDTFTVRGYGEARDANGRVLARAYCEAVVQRTPDYLDSTDDRQLSSPVSNINQTFGRRFEIIQFRWLSKDELG
ncbi:MAG: hypothetical protein ACPG6P_07385 [Akkermansiaceae bacterium]